MESNLNRSIFDKYESFRLLSKISPIPNNGIIFVHDH